MLLFHTSTQRVRLHCKLMLPRMGLGAVILQNSKPVMFASSALTGAKNYQNLERECLAMIWGMEKFHYFLYGKQFTLETNQKPLVSIYRKHMVEISPRIQRLVVRSFPYQPFNVQYRRERNSTGRCIEQSISNTSGRRWNSASNCGCESHHLQHSCEFQ